jgi:hypothetical protein
MNPQNGIFIKAANSMIRAQSAHNFLHLIFILESLFSGESRIIAIQMRLQVCVMLQSRL